MPLAIIAAVSENGVIGKNNTIPWSLPEDMKRFVTVTNRHPIIMGRLTHESIGMILPRRKNIVVTSHPELVMPGAVAVKTLDAAIRLAERENELVPFVIGGSNLYKEALIYATRLYITKVHRTIEDGDAHFPSVDWGQWNCVDKEQHKDYTFSIYERRDPWDARS